MGHTLMLEVSGEAWEELVRIAGEKSQTPELIASEILNDLLPDPLLKLMGTFDSPVPDVAARHDDYIGDGIYTEHMR